MVWLIFLTVLILCIIEHRLCKIHDTLKSIDGKMKS